MNILALLDGNFFYTGSSNIIYCYFRREVYPDRLAAIKLNNASNDFRERLCNALNRTTRLNSTIPGRDLTVRITENPNTGIRDVSTIYYGDRAKFIDIFNVDLGNAERNRGFRNEFACVILSILTTGWWPESYNVTQRSNIGRSIHEIDLRFCKEIPNIEQEQKFKDYMHGDELIDRINNCAELCGSAKEIPIVIRSRDFAAKITDTSIEENVLYIDIEIDGAQEKEEKEEPRPREPRRRRAVTEDHADTLREEHPETGEENFESEGEDRTIIAGDGLRAQTQHELHTWLDINPEIYEQMENTWRSMNINSFAYSGTTTGTAVR